MYLGDDSFFLSETLRDYLKDKDKKLKIFDLGSGTGIQAETCLKLGFANILTSDIGNEEIENLKRKKFNVIRSDLFSNIEGKFDIIIFNPPYLPESKFDKETDTTGGKSGNETVIRFLQQAKTHLEKNGGLILLFSSFSKPPEILKTADNLNYKAKLLAKKRIFFEELFIYDFTLIL